jgi:hypothetical protein
MRNFEDWIEKQPRSRRLKYHWAMLALALLSIVQYSIKLWHLAPQVWRMIFGTRS